MIKESCEVMPNETEKTYSIRLFRYKDVYGLSNKDIADLVNKAFEQNKDESAYRKYAHPFIKGFDEGFKKGIEESQDNLRFPITPKGHLDNINNILTQYDVKKRACQLQQNALRRAMREVLPAKIVAEEIKEIMTVEGFSLPKVKIEKLDSDKKRKAILHLTDFHIGALYSDTKGNNYNLEVAKERVGLLLSTVLKEIDLYGIDYLYVVNTGDMVEHTYMRKNQSSESEFPLSVQIVEVVKLITLILSELSKKVPVEYHSLAGNHDRMEGDKGLTMRGDNTNVIVNSWIKDILNSSDNPNLIVNDYSPMVDEILLDINGVCHKFIHGDDKTKDLLSLIKKEMSIDNSNYNLWTGHWHSFNMMAENNGRFCITTGCLSGYNEYSKRFGCSTFASQTLAVIAEDGKFEVVKPLILQ